MRRAPFSVAFGDDLARLEVTQRPVELRLVMRLGADFGRGLRVGSFDATQEVEA
jgi:hypothetical protein